MGAQRFVAVVGARALPESFASQVAEVVRCFTARGWGIGSGGARGADQFALTAVIATGRLGCARSTVFLPGTVGGARNGALHTFAQLGGRVVAGSGAGRAALLGRSRRLVQASSGVVAFLWGPSRGSVFTVREAVNAGKPAAVVLAGGGAVLPSFQGGGWVPCSVGTVAAFRWVPKPQGAEERGPVKSLHRIFVVPDGEPTQSLMDHISSLTQGERLWFEQGVLAGDTVLVPHEALSDTPAFLAAPRLRRRFHCTVREAVDLAELFLALEASPVVVQHYEGEARQRGVAAIVEDLVHLIACLELSAECPESDALEHAECLGDRAEQVSSDDAVVPAAPEEVAATLAWHALGSVQPESVGCPVCGARYEVDDDAAELPACAECAAPNTWEAQQGPAFRRLVAEIDECPSLVALGELGRRLYAEPLAGDQGRVAWSHFRLRRAALEAVVALGRPARALLAQVERAPAPALPRLGAKLYRLQHAGAVAVGAEEWRRIWRSYQHRKVARPA